MGIELQPRALKLCRYGMVSMRKTGSPITRRSFLHSSAMAGVFAGLRPILPSYSAFEPDVRGMEPQDVSPGRKVYDLTIEEVRLDIEGRSTTATAINGSVPGPLLRFREGDDVTLRVTNKLHEDTSIHWHGILLPFDQDGVPGVSFPGIKPGETFTYRYTIRQTGTYWYHSHSGLQEQTGVYGPIIIDPAGEDPHPYDREYVVVLGDWTFEDPKTVLSKLRKFPGYYNYQRRTLLDLFRNADGKGFGSDLKDRLAWARMRMDATDIADITGATYTYLINGMGPEDNWTGVFRPGERVRLRFINAGAGTFFDVRIPGLEMTVVQADGQDVQPVTVDEFRIAIAETYDVIVQPKEDRAYTIFAESMDRSGFARGTLAPREGMTAEIPPRRRRPLRTMADMGMDHGSMGMDGMAHGEMGHGEMAHGEMAHGEMGGAMAMGAAQQLAPAGAIPEAKPHGPDTHGPGNAAVPMQTRSRLHEAGVGLGNDGRRVLLYTDLRALPPGHGYQEPAREIELHLTGNMERYMWSFDGKEYSRAPDPVELRHGEWVRLVLVNDTMMEHPIHLHGMWMVLENGTGPYLPRKHTVNVKPAERLSVLVHADAPGPWAFHCHILYHMDMGMFRVVRVSGATAEEVE